MLFARAAAVLCMAGYNSTLEALAAGRRPILVPRRSPRREQAIRACAAGQRSDWRTWSTRALPPARWPGCSTATATWRRRELDRAGIALDGADNAAALLVELARERSPR